LTLADTGTVDQAIAASPPPPRVSNGAITAVAIRTVRPKRRGFPSDLAHLLRDRVHGFLLDVDDRDIRPVVCQPQRDPAADSLSRAGDERHFPLNPHTPILR